MPRRPALVRAFNVLRQYPEERVWAGLDPAAGRAGPGRRAGRGHLRRDRPPRGLGHPARACRARTAGPGRARDAVAGRSITFSARLASLDRPSDLAERLPKALIHRNVPGEPVHQFLRDFDRAWDRAAPYSAFGPRQRWLAAVAALSVGWPVLRAPPCGGPRRWRLGEVTLPWTALAPARLKRPVTAAAGPAGPLRLGFPGRGGQPE